MDRRIFLKDLGLSGGAIFATYCLGACSKKESVKPTTSNSTGSNLDFTLNLDESANSALKTNGGWIISNQVVIARTSNGSFAAVTQICSHEGFSQVAFQPTQNKFACSVHGAEFDLNGKGLNSLGTGGLRVYSTSLNGNLLRVFS